MMKGVMVSALKELVSEQFGPDRWQDALDKAGLPRGSSLGMNHDVGDDVVRRVVGAAGDVLSLTPGQAADAFGGYWSNWFAPRVFAAYYRGANSSREFVTRLNYVHQVYANSDHGARPPRFGLQWKDRNTLVMTYESPRQMIDLAVGMLRGVGEFYGEDLEVTRLGDNQIQVVFPS